MKIGQIVSEKNWQEFTILGLNLKTINEFYGSKLRQHTIDVCTKVVQYHLFYLHAKSEEGRFNRFPFTAKNVLDPLTPTAGSALVRPL